MGDYYDSWYEQQCPACKTTKYRNPNMKLMVNVCGHALCDSCVKLLFIKEAGECPECDTILKRSKFRIQVFEDPIVEKEIDIRRRVLRVYIKQEDDFSSTEEWNNYLEEIEELVYNLVNDVNKADCEKKLEYLEKHNKDDIKKKYAKKSQSEEELERFLEDEKIRSIERSRIIKEEDKQDELNKLKNQSSLLQDLMMSDGDAALIVKSHSERLRQAQLEEKEKQVRSQVESNLSRRICEFSSGIKFGLSGSSINNTPSEQDEEMYKYEAHEMSNCLRAPSAADLEEGGYLNHVRAALPQATAGGYVEQYACLRALQEFMWGLILSTE